jgi:phospholipase/lecithinase/hemolysin
MLNILRHSRRALLALCLSFGASFTAQATYSNMYIFGDSLSDTGNVYIASGGTEPPDPPYYQGRLSNGPTWVETLASGLGLPGDSTALLAGGKNYAWAGAFSGVDGLAGPNTGLQAQVFGQWSGIADPGALYVVGAGSNDLRYVDGSNLPAATPYSDPATVLGNLLFSLSYMIEAGATNFLVANIPDLGLVPESAGHRAESTALAIAYNSALATALDALATAHQVTIMQFDLFGLLNDVVSDTLNGGGQYGFLDATTPCFAPGAISCDQSVFADFLHPTARVHELAGNAALALIAANQVPEPATLALLVGALLAFAASRRRA